MPSKLIVFALASAGLVYASGASLRAPRSHGFYRFFAWEFILILILLNLEVWFRSPFSIHQVASWILLLISAYLAVHGAYLLHTGGIPDKKRDDATIAGFEKTTALVTIGPYKYIRHPLYSSLLLLAWGVFFKDISPLSSMLVLAATLFLVVAAKIEEVENIRFFGPPYLSYMENTKMFIPFLV